MSKKENKLNRLLEKLNCVDKDICDISEKIKVLKSYIISKTSEEEDFIEEVCPDVEESEQAVIKAIENLYVEELLSREPEGEA